MNKYEKSLLTNLKIIRVVTILAVLLNLFVPVAGKLIGYKNPLQWFIIGFYIIGYLYINGYGYGEQYIPLVPIIVLRGLELGIFTIVAKYVIRFIPDLNVGVFFAVHVLMDVLYLILLYIDKSNYYYERVEVAEHANKEGNS